MWKIVVLREFGGLKIGTEKFKVKHPRLESLKYEFSVDSKGLVLGTDFDENDYVQLLISG